MENASNVDNSAVDTQFVEPSDVRAEEKAAAVAESRGRTVHVESSGTCSKG